MDLSQILLASAPHGLYVHTTNPANSRQHPLRDVSIVQGPTYLDRFRAHKWVFRVRITDNIRLTLHHEDPENLRERNINELQRILTSAFNQCLLDGARREDYVHVYMECTGMDSTFIFNPCGSKAVTLNTLLQPLGLHDMLEKFARLIQSGKNVYLDDKTIITIYTFNPPTGGSGSLFFTSNREEFLNASKSVVKIKNPADQTCYCLAFVLGMTQLSDKKEYNALRNKKPKRWFEQACALHTSLGLSIHEPITNPLMNTLSDLHQTTVHIFDISAVRPGFAYHTPNRGYLKHLFFLRDGNHFHYISNMNGILKIFHRNQYHTFCENCFKTYDKRYTHTCTPEGTDMVLGKRKVSYFPNEGEEKEVSTYITRTKVKKQRVMKDEEGNEHPVEKKVLYLDFETRVVGKSRTGGKDEPPSTPPVFDWNTPYVPAPYQERVMDTTLYEYMQEVNHCEIQDEAGTAFVFKSLGATMDFLNLPKYRGALLIAHCGGMFDFQLIYRMFLGEDQLRMKKVKDPLLRGNKIVSAEIMNDIKMIDSYSFVAHALAKFPTIFNIPELKKGFFPHTFNRPGFEDYKGAIPHYSYYEPDNFSPSKRAEFFEWYAEQVKQEHIFVFKREMEDYCHSDVELLRVGMSKFRQEFRNLVDGDGNSIGVDPYDHLTIAGVAFEGVYCKYFLPEDTIAVVPRPAKDSYSWQSILWLEDVMKTHHVFIQHAHNQGEYRITIEGKSFPVDGFCEETNTIYQFHGCFWHGCAHCYEASANTPHRVKTVEGVKGPMKVPVKFGELYAHTLFMSERYRSFGFKVEEMWECQWKDYAVFKKIDTTKRDIEYLKAVVPRDAYFGGRTNAVKLYYKCRNAEKIHYMDITSMYPFVMSDAQYFFPVGLPEIYRKDKNNLIPLEELFGVIKCEIEPPQDLYLPVLPERAANGKVLFHNRRMIGTWTSVEVQKAISKGYKILEVFEQHHFPNKSNELFRRYNETFFEIKRAAKAEKNKGREAIAKMCINGPTGKWGFNPAKQKGSRIITQTDEFFKYFWGAWDHVSLSLIDDNVCLASVEESDEYTEHRRSNVYISAFITGYSRLKLYNEALEPLDRLVLYFDTDSVIYVSPNGDHLIPNDTTGAMGLWTSEADTDDYFTEFVSAGPKTYALKSFSGKKDIAKSKGFSLHFANSQIFNLETLKDQVICKVTEVENEKLVLHKKETIMRRKKFRILVEQNKGKVINMTYDKRQLKELTEEEFDEEDIYCVDTLPWGYHV